MVARARESARVGCGIWVARDRALPALNRQTSDRLQKPKASLVIQDFYCHNALQYLAKDFPVNRMMYLNIRKLVFLQ